MAEVETNRISGVVKGEEKRILYPRRRRDRDGCTEININLISSIRIHQVLSYVSFSLFSS